MKSIAQACFSLAAGLAIGRGLIIALDGLTPKVVAGTISMAFVIVAISLLGASFYAGAKS